MKRALVLGITGMDGSHLADFLLEKNYEVFGLVRRSSTTNHWRIQHILDKIILIEGDLLDRESLEKAIIQSRPDEVYNLAAQSFVGASFNMPIYTAECTGIGALNLIEAVKSRAPKARVYQASSSEMFGKVRETPQYETTPFHPRSPYGCAKCFAHYTMINYRESYDMHISCGIAFNHESARRGKEFVTRKITYNVAQIIKGNIKSFSLGNINVSRDWGYAPDYVEAMWLMLQQDDPDDYVLATGKLCTLEQFLYAAFAHVGILNYKDYVTFNNPSDVRPAEVSLLRGNPEKINKKLGWKAKTDVYGIVTKMMEAELKGT